MKTYKILIIFTILIVGLIALQAIMTKRHNAQPHLLDNFAKELKTAGAKFYGHYQCAHCQKQKDLFDTAQQYLPYVECGILGKTMGGGQTKICEDNKIEGYPTWVFTDGTRKTGVQSIEVLAKSAHITIPAEYIAPKKLDPAIYAPSVSESLAPIKDQEQAKNTKTTTIPTIIKTTTETQ
jgi:hypothetical protein